MSLIPSKQINKTACEMRSLIKKSKKKLLEFEIMMSMLEIKRGEFDTFKTADELFKKMKCSV